MSPVNSFLSQSFAIATTFPKISTNGLTLHLDAGQQISYTGGNVWKDLSGKDSSATLFNDPTYTTDNGGLFSFNGSYGICSGSPLNPNSYTKSVWFRLSSYSSNNNLVSCDPGHFMFFSGTDKLYCGHSDWGWYNAFPSATDFSLGTWYNACLTFNTDDGMVLYVNGVQDSTYTATKTPAPGSGIEIASFSSGNLLIGDIAEVLVYNRSITEAEVKQNFNALKSRFGI
mgnify:CR=1 FL=1